MYEVTKTDGSRVEYLSAAETARLVRAALARKFPETKFYVRSRTFAGGAAVDVYYDGRDEEWNAKPGVVAKSDVESVANAFSGKNFDGMIDFGYSNDVYLDAEGMPVGGRSSGSAMTGGMHSPYDRGAEKAARVVSTGCWISVNDHLPYDVREKEEAKR